MLRDDGHGYVIGDNVYDFPLGDFPLQVCDDGYRAHRLSVEEYTGVLFSDWPGNRARTAVVRHDDSKPWPSRNDEDERP